jgi:hypothetical protein
MVRFSVGVLTKIVVLDMYKALSIHKIRQNTKIPTLNKTLYLEKTEVCTKGNRQIDSIRVIKKTTKYHSPSETI